MGGIHSNVRDLLRYINAFLEPPEGEMGHAIELAWQIHQPPLSKADFAKGLGWNVAHDGHTRFHNGQTGGFHSSLFLDRRSRSGVIVLANTSSMEVDVLAESLIRMLMGMKENPRKFEHLAKVSAETVQRYVGRYQLAPNVIFTVTAKGRETLCRVDGATELSSLPSLREKNGSIG